ncbi:MAG: 16S rRNA (cytosine(967)-C(5))-methyltransferase RsmB [Nitrospirae bacterium]|nr:MAG: 16S rRNA (cytosine(967)-C(5))-methyltransferase RsmB [Nitrospirota bacterium]
MALRVASLPARQTARSVALSILMSVFRRRQSADEVLHAELERTNLSVQDRALVHALVYGVLRFLLTLDWRLNHVADRPMARLPLVVAMILRLAAYQMLYLDRIPHSAATFEAVAMARRIGGRDWRGFVNAVLRALARTPPPLGPDLEGEPSSALSIRYSCPQWIVDRWLSRQDPATVARLCDHTIQIPPITLRTNTLRCTRETLAKRLAHVGIRVHETAVSPVGLTLDHCGSLSQLDVWQEGWCYAEDEAAQLIPLLLDVQPGHRVLDACAAPGGKTTHMAQLMRNQGLIVAVDRDACRLRKLAENCRRLGVTNVVEVCGDLALTPEPGRFSPEDHSERSRLFEHLFDRILIDAPCSGFGVLRRHPEGKWFKSPDSIQRAQRLQYQLLLSAARLLRPGGLMVYSACSIEPEETRELIERFLRDHPEFLLESVEPWLPASGQALCDPEGYFVSLAMNMDGFFAARLQKEKPS